MANEIQKQTNSGVASERFTNNVLTQFEAETGRAMVMSEYQKSLAQHLFLKIDSVLKELETKRTQNPKPFGTPITWDNVNMRKLSLDAVHTVQLGLDPLIPNHVHPIPYFNNKEKKYDVDLRAGYIGKAYYRIQAAREDVDDVIYELVYSTDKFKAIKKTIDNPQDSYEFEIMNPFDRGDIIGGFGYISYGNKKSNTLVLVSKKDFEKSKAAAKTKTFWDKHYDEMCMKTLIHRTTDKIQVDPKKINAAYLEMESKEEVDGPIKEVVPYEDEINLEIEENSASQVIDFSKKEEPKTTKVAEPVKEEAKPAKEVNEPEKDPNNVPEDPGF